MFVSNTALSLLCLLITIPLNASVNTLEGFREEPDTFYFAITGDRTGHEVPGVFEEMLQKVNRLRPAFVVNVGDNIQGYTDDPNTVNQQWEEFDRMIGHLEMPYLTVPGNHDISNQMMAGIYQKRFQTLYYHILYKNVLFLFLNTDDPSAEIDPAAKRELYEQKIRLRQKIDQNEFSFKLLLEAQEYRQKTYDLAGGQISDEQSCYFQKVLQDNAGVRWTFVIMHKPIWLKSTPHANWRKIETILADRPYTVVAGHEHINAYTIRNNRDYIVMGGSGAAGMPSGLPGVYQHLLWVAMGPKKPAITNLLNDGILRKDEVKALDAETDSTDGKTPASSDFIGLVKKAIKTR
jgi:hypothetical protein